MDTLESIRGKSEGAKDLKSVVSAMKAMASSNIIQYETAVVSLGDYYHTVALGIIAYFKSQQVTAISKKMGKRAPGEKVTVAIVFGSDQGLVGQFNDGMAEFVSAWLNGLPGKKEIWVIGERVELLLSDMGFAISSIFAVPESVNKITALVDQLLIKSEGSQEQPGVQEFYIFHNQPKAGAGYQQVMQRFLPLDEKWRGSLVETPWPTKLLPQVAGGVGATLKELISGYLFVSLYKASAESLASENASRLEAMQRAERNIGDLLDELNKKYHRLRQSSIDEELFDVVSGFEALKLNQTNIQKL